jgi:hypothetical protein
MPNFIKFWCSQAPRIQIRSNLAQVGSLILYSNFILNFEKLQYKKISLFNYLQIYILFGIFGAQEGIFWIASFQISLNIVWNSNSIQISELQSSDSATHRWRTTPVPSPPDVVHARATSSPSPLRCYKNSTASLPSSFPFPVQTLCQRHWSHSSSSLATGRSATSHLPSSFHAGLRKHSGAPQAHQPS